MEHSFATGNVNIAPELPGFSWIFEPGLDRQDVPATGLANGEPLWHSRKEGGLSTIVPSSASNLQVGDPHSMNSRTQAGMPVHDSNKDSGAAAAAAAAASGTLPPAGGSVGDGDALGVNDMRLDGANAGAGGGGAVTSGDMVGADPLRGNDIKGGGIGSGGMNMDNVKVGPNIERSSSMSDSVSSGGSRSSKHSVESLSLPGSLSSSYGSSLSGSLPGSLPSSMPSSLPGSIPSPVQAAWPFMPGVEYTTGLPFSTRSMSGFGGPAPAGMPPLAHLSPSYGTPMGTPLGALGPMQSVQSHGAPPPPNMEAYGMPMSAPVTGPEDETPGVMHREMRATYGSQLKRCPVCQKVLRRDLTRHMRIHEAVAEFRCPFPRDKCNHKRGQFNRPYEYKKHMMNSHFVFNNQDESRNAPNLQERLRLEGRCHCGAGEMSADDWIMKHVGGRECPLLQHHQPQP